MISQSGLYHLFPSTTRLKTQTPSDHFTPVSNLSEELKLFQNISAFFPSQFQSYNKFEEYDDGILNDEKDGFKSCSSDFPLLFGKSLCDSFTHSKNIIENQLVHYLDDFDFIPFQEDKIESLLLFLISKTFDNPSLLLLESKFESIY